MCTRGNTACRSLLTILCFWGFEKGGSGKGRSTWLVHTLLNVTKAKVCASMVDGRSFFARRRGRAMAERKSWGMKARDSSFMA